MGRIIDEKVPCQHCGKELLPEEVIPYQCFEICMACNVELAGKVKQTVYEFMGIPLETKQLQMTYG